MKVATYSSHHSLPFWHTPENPDGLYDPTILDGWVIIDRDGTSLPATEHCIIPVLDGLQSLDLPGVMAHVSIIFDKATKVVSSPHRMWVQITTEPAGQSAEGVPIIVKDKVVQVRHLWGGDNHTYSPYGFLKPGFNQKEIVTREFWSNFFLTRLRETKVVANQRAESERRAAEELAHLYDVIPN